MNATIRSLFVVLALVALVGLPQAAFAQRGADAKARGDYSGTFWSTKSARREVFGMRAIIRAACKEYVKSTPKPVKPYLQAEAAEIGKNLSQAKAELTYLEKNAGSDKEVAAAITSIHKHLTAADAEFQKLHGECEKDAPDAAMCDICCSSLSDHLGKAHDELEALQKKLAPQAIAPPKK